MSYTTDVSDLRFSRGGEYLVVRAERLAAASPARTWVERSRAGQLLAGAGRRASRNLTPEEWHHYLPEQPCRAAFAHLSDACSSAAPAQRR